MHVLFEWKQVQRRKDTCTLEQGSEKSRTAIKKLYKTDKVFKAWVEKAVNHPTLKLLPDR